jgi:uncharacterized protein YegP (UPF0339 family)
MAMYGFDGVKPDDNEKCPKTGESVCNCSAGEPREFELYRDEADEFRWRLRAKNGRVIATSGEGYKNKADAEHGISLVKNASGVTEVQDLT